MQRSFLFRKEIPEINSGEEVAERNPEGRIFEPNFGEETSEENCVDLFSHYFFRFFVY
jgi:hypothetical protein